MKRLLRRTAGVLIFSSGWILAAAALHVVVTPGRLTIMPKDRLGFSQTFVDARHWTLADVSSHPVVSDRLVHLGREQLLYFVTDSRTGNPHQQLETAITHPVTATSTGPAIVQRLRSNVAAAAETVKAVFD